ncbi:hypothetical protein AWC38_SpisGene23977 [Stylophora pistillata]|uniref:Transient receptor potential cation channel subfamily V member 4 n=1 Tax=Stylophora pistillata TaxID=50429 RepID=A0A2B4R768_STYPI|nr:hypothetical protein AWC38_SpisGene23977 [Stylophora pistillata]
MRTVNDRGQHESDLCRDYQQDFIREEFDKEFWLEVHGKQNKGLSWNRAMDEVQAERLIQKYKEGGELNCEDPALLMLKKWPTSVEYKDNPEKLRGLEQLINRFLEILLESELNSGNRYRVFQDEYEKKRKTLMHYAAELGFLHVTKTLVRKCPEMITMTMENIREPVKKRAMLPVELAIEAEKDSVAAFLIQINRFLEILLESELNSGNRYRVFQDEYEKKRKTLMHYAAELGFLHVTKTLVRKCPEMITMTMENIREPVKKRAMLPVELAIEAEKDSVAAFLIQVMSPGSIQNLFSWTPGKMTNPRPSFFSFRAIIENPNMKKTVVALLDQMMNPQWPYLPQRQENYQTEEERVAIEGVWNTISDNPLNYHFYYHILDGDEGGRPPKILASDERKQIENKYFNWRDSSCLCAIAKSSNKEALQHPVVRMLIKTKWRSYGHLFLSLQAALFCIFLLFISYSLLHASTKVNPIHYSGALDSLRGFCEIVTLLMVVFYICEEINQIRIGFGEVLLSGFRAMSEQYPMTEDYSTFNWLSVVLMMAYMGTVTVILLNILIAQMSTTYIQAKKVARLEYDVDRILQLTRMERFPFLNLRVKYYKEGDWISEIKLAKELLEFSEDRNPWESVEEKLNEIRDLMRKMVKQMRPGQE